MKSPFRKMCCCSCCFFFLLNNINERNSILYFKCVLFSFVLQVLFQPSTNILVVIIFGTLTSLMQWERVHFQHNFPAKTSATIPVAEASDLKQLLQSCLLREDITAYGKSPWKDQAAVMVNWWRTVLWPLACVR